MSQLRLLEANLHSLMTLVPWRMRPKLIAILIGSVLVALLDMAAVFLLLPITQIVSGTRIQDSSVLLALADLTGLEDTRSLLLATLLAVVVMMTTKSVATYFFRRWSLGIMAEAQAAATGRVMGLYASSPWASHRRRSSEHVLQTLNIYLPSAFSGVMTNLMSLVVDGITILTLFALLFVVSPLATAAAIVIFGGLALLIQVVLKRRITPLAVRQRDINLETWSFMAPVVDGFREIRLAEEEAAVTNRYAETLRRLVRTNRDITLLNELPRYLMEVIMVLGITVIALILFATMNSAAALGFLGVFAVAAIRIIPSLNRMVSTIGLVRAALPNLESLILELNRLEGEEGRRPLGETDEHQFPAADIEFRDLTYRFPDGEAPVLDHVSGTIRQGHTIALVGSSGAGKTTFVELLLGLLEPQEGDIQVEGVSIYDHPVAWRRQLGVVSQDVYLLDKTVRDNIVFLPGSDPATTRDVARAVDMAQLSDVIDHMPNGLETKVGHRGTRVSGGQRQRIGIARALYRDPQLLILDEATSALDNVTEAKITQTIKDLHGAMTIVVVAHRLSTVQHADQILFFSQGRIAARGTLEELTKTNAEFAELVRLGRLA